MLQPVGSRSASRMMAAGNVPLGLLLPAVFVSFLLICSVCTIYLMMSSAKQAVNDVLEQVAHDVSSDTFREINRFLRSPDIINQNLSRAIRAGRVDIHDKNSLLRFFRDVSEREGNSVSAAHFTTVAGDFVGLQGAYAPKPDGSLSALTERGAPYDARLSRWYRKAVESPRQPVWTDVHLEFGSKIPTITRAISVENDRGEFLGVAGVDLFLSQLPMFAGRLSPSDNSEVFIVLDDGRILGSYGLAYEPDYRFKEIPATGSFHRFTAASTRYFQDIEQAPDSGGLQLSRFIELDNQKGYLNVTPVAQEFGLSWSLGVFVPESDYPGSMRSRFMKVVPFGLAALLFFAVAVNGFIILVIQPLRKLNVATACIATGQFNVPIDTSRNNEIGVLAKAIDLMRNQLKVSFRELLVQKERAETTLHSIADGVIVTNKEGHITYINTSAEIQTGWCLRDALGKSVETVFKPQELNSFTALTFDNGSDRDQLHREGTLIKRNGECTPIHFKCTPLLSNTVQMAGSVIIFTDLSERLQLKSELLHQASHDPLTNLINRRAFEAAMQRAIDDAKLTGNAHAVCYLDLDQVKIVNDTCGHIAGDELLRQVALLFKSEVRAADTLARLGGDEFGILLNNCTIEKATAIVNRLLTKMRQFQFCWEDRIFNVGVSIGLAPVTKISASVVSVLRDADSACYVAKESGRNRVHLLCNNDDELNARRQQVLWVDKIERALQANEFVLYSQNIQPLVDSGSGGDCFEILVRLRGERGELIPPGQFLPAAERFGLATGIDQWVVANTLQWLAENPRCVSGLQMCAINLSGQSLGDDSFLSFVKEQLRDSAIDPGKICFEITETASVANLSRAMVFMKAIKELGCLFSLDDFGSGFSSFAYLKSLPVDFLKIDGLLVRDIIDDEIAFAMVRSINEVGQILGKRTIAEFVESDAVRNKLGLLGVDYVQGFGVGMPVPLECRSANLSGVQTMAEAA